VCVRVRAGRSGRSSSSTAAAAAAVVLEYFTAVRIYTARVLVEGIQDGCTPFATRPPPDRSYYVCV